jgi:hypothetical protein
VTNDIIGTRRRKKIPRRPHRLPSYYKKKGIIIIHKYIKINKEYKGIKKEKKKKKR